ncbi:Gfo/Idh/MocA family protein [Tabrizicola sp.]|uniref:Gfo/Idh/MocA family protein n=1 Tax=Tabrizicola sp. TaxID=2005166 RepID=UPI002734A78C|nr:Gfo/Idh/MocA family oxidoreductase [Tabrizicola sp.]MDP3195331.1 Gfo/Idh/MocA family oxidoreductase [Tabrizicola sp.]
MLRIGVVGYGTGGKHFHAPFIQAARGCTLAGVVARAEKTIAAAKADLPDQPIYPSLTAMIASGQVDAVAITTPPETRRELVLEAIAAGLHVVADKPFAPDAARARDFDRAAKAKGVVLGVYQNRRFDSDIQTLRQVLIDRRLGRLWRIHSRMDFDDPATLEAGPTGGLLRDLGSHLVDQMLWLLGPAISVDAQMDHVNLPGGRTDASFTITLRHESGVHSHISATKLNRLNCRELRAYGEAGSYVTQSTDIQAQQLFSGKRPAADPTTWGYEPETHWGTLRTVTGAEIIRAAQGRYHDYYDLFAAAVRNGTPPPVTAEVGARTLAVLDAARQSDLENRSITLDVPHG